MKTVFIPIFSGNEGRFILRSDIYRTLVSRSNLQIVFFVRSEARKVYYQREFNNPRIRFEVMPPQRLSSTDACFSFLKYYLLRTRTIDLKRKTRYEREGNFLRFLASFVANRILARRVMRWLVRFLDQRLVSVPAVAKYFERFVPDIVFLADLFDDTQAAFVREARRRNIRSVGMILTWDRATSRWLIRLLPDSMLVHNDYMRDEVCRYQDMLPDAVALCGTIQHDSHVKEPPLPRAEFCRRMGIPSQNKIILYGPIGRSFDTTKELDQTMIDILNGWIEAGELGTKNVTLVVRFPPNDFLKEGDRRPRPQVIYQEPGYRFSGTRGQDWDMSFDDLAFLRDTVANSDLVITYYSSLSIDAAVFDKPVININFNIEGGAIAEKRHPYYETTHYQKAAATGGIRLVGNASQLKEWIRRYLADPSYDRVGRAILVSTQCGKVDGKSGRRAGEFLLSQLEIVTTRSLSYSRDNLQALGNPSGSSRNTRGHRPEFQ
jgi:hypothetical protein